MSEQHSPTPESNGPNPSSSHAPTPSNTNAPTPRFRAFEPEAQPPASFRVESSDASEYNPESRPAGNFRNDPPMRSFERPPAVEPTSHNDRFAFGDEPDEIQDEPSPFMTGSPSFKSEASSHKPETPSFEHDHSDFEPETSSYQPDRSQYETETSSFEPSTFEPETTSHETEVSSFKEEPAAFRSEPEAAYTPPPPPQQSPQPTAQPSPAPVTPSQPAARPAMPEPMNIEAVATTAPKAPAAPEPQPTAPAVNAYTIKKPEFRDSEPVRPDQTQPMHMVGRRKQYLPTMYGLWWMATLVFFLIVSALIAFHALEYWGYDPLAIRWESLQDKYVFLSLGGSMLATLFLIWILQNTAKGLTNSKPNPETAYNNVYGVMLCLLIIGSMKMTSDVMAETTDARSGGQLQWLRDNAFGPGSNNDKTPVNVATTSQTSATNPEPAETPDPKTGADKPATTASLNTPATTTKPTTTRPVSTTGRNLPQAKPQTSSQNSSTQIRVGDPTKSVMASSMRAFQSAAGKARLADQRVMVTPQPDLANLNSAAPIEAVAMAHLDAFEAHLELARIAATLPDTARVQMLGAGASVEQTEEQVASLQSLLSLDSAVMIQNAEAGVHGARAAYAGFLAQHFGKWSVEGGTVTFENAELGATAVDLQKAIGQRETELKAARYDAVAG